MAPTTNNVEMVEPTTQVTTTGHREGTLIKHIMLINPITTLTGLHSLHICNSGADRGQTLNRWTVNHRTVPPVTLTPRVVITAITESQKQTVAIPMIDYQ
jgi:hypothetical protein